MDSKTNELRAVEAQWRSLDDSSIIRDVLFKGRHISSAIKFIGERRQIAVDEAKEIFFEVCDNIVGILVQNRQLARASHVLRNAQVNELVYLFGLYRELPEEDARRPLLLEHLRKLSADFDSEQLPELEAYHACFKLLQANIHNHVKYLDCVNRNHNNNVVTVNSIYKVSFATFMKQPVPWRNEMAVDVFFKSKRHADNLKLMPIIGKKFLFAYIIQSELTGLLRKWLNEQYCSMAGRTIRSTLAEPQNFDEALNFLFRKWTFEPDMMNQISRREKDVIKNEFAKLGLFEAREAKQVCRKLNRFFTTHTFVENCATLKSDEVTKFIIENQLVDLLPQPFIDHAWVQVHLSASDDSKPLHHELTLLQATKDLLAKSTTLDDFVRVSKATSDYIRLHDPDFDGDARELTFFAEILADSPEALARLAGTNDFTSGLCAKLKASEHLPPVEELLATFQAVDLDYVLDEFAAGPSFDDAHLRSAYGAQVALTYADFVRRGQGVYASFVFLVDAVRDSASITRQMVVGACEEVVRMALGRFEDATLVTHAVAFLETFAVDTRPLRCLLRLMRLPATQSGGNFAKRLDASVQVADGDEESLKDAEALEVYWRTTKVAAPPRSYLSAFAQSGDWLKLISLAQYFDVPLDDLAKICQSRLASATLVDNLTRAVSYAAPSEPRRRHSFSKTRKPSDDSDDFAAGKFLDTSDDLFAVLLRCDEKVDRTDTKFDDFQRIFAVHQSADECDESEAADSQSGSTHTHSEVPTSADSEATASTRGEAPSAVNDLLFRAVQHDWPLLAVLAGTTKLYRYKHCWLTWLALSSNWRLRRRHDDLDALATHVFLHTVRAGYVRTLDESVQVFYPHSPLRIFTGFLRATADSKFDGLHARLKLFIVELSECDFRMTVVSGKEKAIALIMRALVLHLQHNVRFPAEQELYLECLHRSEIAGFGGGAVDFKLMQRLCRRLEFTNVRVNYEAFCEGEQRVAREIERLCDELIANDHFEAAIEVAECAGKSKENFIFKWWQHMHQSDAQRGTSFDFDKYLKYVEDYGLSMKVFVRFLLVISLEMDECVDKYSILTFLHRHMPIDNMEYAIHLLYVRLRADGVTELRPFTSLHYEEVVKREKLVHETLDELKAIARIDELTVSQKRLDDERELVFLEELICRLLDLNDLVEALRVHEMFGCAPEDLRLLAYMLSVCEGVSSIYDITKQERQTISSYATLSNRFNRFAFRSLRAANLNDSSMASSSSTTLSTDALNESLLFDDSARYKENKETLQAMQGLVCKIKHGVGHAQRALLLYRASLLLNRSFTELMRIRDGFEFLELAATTADCDQKLLVMADVVEAMSLSPPDVARFIAKEITVSIIRTRFAQFTRDIDLSASTSSCSQPLVSDDIWGFSLARELHLILELCKRKTSLLGALLLRYYKILSRPSLTIPFASERDENDELRELLNLSLDGPQVISLSKQNRIRAELLIVAHECFSQECSAEGIGEILRLAKRFVHELPRDGSGSLIVRVLCGIGRYREMLYCFDLLVKHEAFEALLGQFSERQTNGLKHALLAYLNESQPASEELFRMAASHFLMHSELARLWRASATRKLDKILAQQQVRVSKTARIFGPQPQTVDVPFLRCTRDLLAQLSDAIADMCHAAEMAAADGKIETSSRFASFCELMAVQVHLARTALAEGEGRLCASVLRLEQSTHAAQYFANYELSVPQTLILARNLDNFQVDFAKVIFCRTLIAGDDAFLLDFCGRCELSDALVENVVRLAQLETIGVRQERVLHDLVLMVRDVGLKFRLASLLGLKRLLQTLLNDEQSYYYLRDSKYGALDLL